MSCSYSPYLIPRLYVRGLESDDHIIVEDGFFRYAGRVCSGDRCYGKTVYGTLLEELVDLVSKRVVRSFAVVLPPRYDEALVVDEGSEIEPIPVEGVRTVIEVCEGSKVKAGDVLALIVTRKYEVRKVRSHVEGVVVYIYSSPEAKPDRNIVFIAGEDVVRKARLQR